MIAIQEALGAGDLDKASRLIQDSLAQHPKDGGLMNLRGVLHAQKNELADARQDFGAAVRLAPALMPAWQNLGRACRQLEEVPCAIDAWQHVLHVKANDQEAHVSLALLYEKQAKFAESLRELDAGRVDNLLVRCSDLSGLGQIPEAKTVAARLASETSFSEAELDTMRGLKTTSKAAAVVVVLAEGLDSRRGLGIPALQRLAAAYEQLQRPADARKTLERVAKLEPDNPAHLMELARLAESGKDFEGALGYLAHARDLTPDNAQVHFLFGLVAGELSLPIEAKASLDKALAIEPENPNYNYAMGSVILQTRDAATAAGYFEKYVSARPADVRGHYALGLAHFASGDYAKAKEEMKRAESGLAMAPAAEYYLGRIARLEGDMEEAARQLRKSLEREPGLSEAHTELGRIALAQGKVALARTELDQALRLAPESFQANEQLLILYKRTHDGRAEKQAQVLKKLDEERSRRAELMLRTIEVRP